MTGNQSAETMEVPDWTFSPHPAVEQAIRVVFAQHPPLYPVGLKRLRRFFKNLGDPHLKLPLTFHVAGTNGKGSTLAFLQAIFETAGMTVHKYTSPHLVSFDERFVVDGKNITTQLLLGLIDECSQAAIGEEISFFEFFTALAFLAFSRSPADAILLETGLGGLYDATNIVESGNLVTLLTSISYDHMHILGDTLPEIATQKAGIIKPQTPCVVAPQEEDVVAVFVKQARALEAPVFLYGKDWEIAIDAGGFEYKSARHAFHLPTPRLQGHHQLYNAGLAIAALENSPYTEILEQPVLEQAMQRVAWPGRLQKITSGPLAALLPAGWELWLDGAHNDAGAAVVAEQAILWSNEQPLHLITAMKRTKDVSGFYGHLLPHAASIQALDSSWIDAPMLTAEDLCDQIRAMDYTNVKTAATLESAIKSITFQFSAPQRILVTGSLYLVGHALKQQQQQAAG